MVFLAVFFQFGPYPAHMLRHHTAVPFRVIAPEFLVDPLLVKHLSGAQGQKFYNLIFLFGKRDYRSLHRHSPGGIIYYHPSPEPHIGIRFNPMIPADVSRHPGPQFLHGKRFQDIIVAPRRKSLDLVAVLDSGREK